MKGGWGKAAASSFEKDQAQIYAPTKYAPRGLNFRRSEGVRSPPFEGGYIVLRAQKGVTPF